MAYVIYNQGREIGDGMFRLGKWSTIFQCELLALRELFIYIRDELEGELAKQVAQNFWFSTFGVSVNQVDKIYVWMMSLLSRIVEHVVPGGGASSATRVYGLQVKQAAVKKTFRPPEICNLSQIIYCQMLLRYPKMLQWRALIGEAPSLS